MNKIEPTQADRDAVAAYLDGSGWVVPATDIRRTLPLVQAFAAHRLASEQLMEQMAEALEALLAEARERGGSVSSGEVMGCNALAAYRAAKGEA